MTDDAWMTEPDPGDDLPLASFGVSGVDAVLHGGLTPGRLYLLDGDPGSGKTTLALQFLMAGVRQGEVVLYVTLSETKQELRGVARSHGWSLQGIHLLELVAEEETLAPDAHLTMFHPSELELSETTRRVLAAVEELQPTRVVFDSLSEMRLLAQSPLRYRRQILALKQFFMGRNCTVLMLDDRTSETMDLQLHSIAHGVVSLEQLAPEYGGSRRRLRVVKMRGMEYEGGYHDFVIARGGIRVFPRLVAGQHPQDFIPAPVPSGIAALDTLLGGGVDRGTSTLLMGPAGCGKSTIAAQYAVAAASRGDHAVLFAFDETYGALRVRSEALGMPFDEQVASGRLRVRQIDPAELSPGEFAHILREHVQPESGEGARVVVIDSLNGFLNSMPEERFLTLQMHEMLAYLAQQGVATLMVMAQHGMVGTSMATPVDASYLADAVVLLRFFEVKGRVRRAISVFKKRTGAHEDTIRELRMGPDGIDLGEPLEEFQGILTGVPSFVGEADAIS